MFVTKDSNVKRLATGKSARRLAGMAAIALAASTAAQQAQAATLTMAYQAVYISPTLDTTDNPQPVLNSSDPGYQVLYGTDPNGNSGIYGAVPSNNQMTITLSVGQYLAYDMSGGVTGIPNPTSTAVNGGSGPSVYDSVNHVLASSTVTTVKSAHTTKTTIFTTIPAGSEPTSLGLNVGAWQIQIPNGLTPMAQGSNTVYVNGNTHLQPLYYPGVISGVTRTNAGVASFSVGGAGENGGAQFVDPGDVVGGNVGVNDPPGFGDASPTDAYKLTGGNAGADAGSSTNPNNDIFTGMAFQALSIGTTTISTLSRTSSIGFVTYQGGGTSTNSEPTFGSVPFNSTNGDAVVDVPALTIVVVTPEPASIGLIGGAATLLLARRRKAKKA